MIRDVQGGILGFDGPSAPVFWSNLESLSVKFRVVKKCRVRDLLEFTRGRTWHADKYTHLRGIVA